MKRLDLELPDNFPKFTESSFLDLRLPLSHQTAVVGDARVRQYFLSKCRDCGQVPGFEFRVTATGIPEFPNGWTEEQKDSYFRGLVEGLSEEQRKVPRKGMVNLGALTYCSCVRKAVTKLSDDALNRTEARDSFLKMIGLLSEWWERRYRGEHSWQKK